MINIWASFVNNNEFPSLNAAHARNIHFLFYLDSDTAFLVSSEMVEQLQLTGQNVQFIAELIDLLLLHLIPGWKTCVPVDHLFPKSRIQSPRGLNDNTPPLEHIKCAVGLHPNAKEAVSQSRSSLVPDSSSLADCIGKMNLGPEFVKLDDTRSPSFYSSEDASVADDGASKKSKVLATCIDLNGKKSSFTSIISESDFKDSHGDWSKGGDMELKGGVESGKCLDDKSRIMEMSSNAYGSVSSLTGLMNVCLSDEVEEDEELRMRLAMIEQQYEEAIKEISKRREEAILEIRKLSKKKIDIVS